MLLLRHNVVLQKTSFMKKFLQEFKEFAVKGNVMDMAIGVIIGGAFGKIVSSLVNDVIMPLISKVTGGATFTELKYELTPAGLQPGRGWIFRCPCIL